MNVGGSKKKRDILHSTQSKGLCHLLFLYSTLSSLGISSACYSEEEGRGERKKKVEALWRCATISPSFCPSVLYPDISIHRHLTAASLDEKEKSIYVHACEKTLLLKKKTRRRAFLTFFPASSRAGRAFIFSAHTPSLPSLSLLFATISLYLD